MLRRLPRYSSIVAAGALALASLPAPATANPATWQAGLAYSIQQGDYGSDFETTQSYVMANLRARWERAELGAVVPYVSATSRPLGSAGQRASTTTAGLGDVVLMARYRAVDSAMQRPALAVAAEVKVPTADRDKDLGTGEFDETLALELTRFLGFDWFAFADVAYTWVGNPPGVSYNDQWRISVGGGTYALRGAVVSAAYLYRTPPAAGDPAPREVEIAASSLGTLGINGAVNFGLSDSVPDFGITLGLYARF